MGRRQLLAALEEIAELLYICRTTARIDIVGGVATAIAYDSDRFTHDIDARVGYHP